MEDAVSYTGGDIKLCADKATICTTKAHCSEQEGDDKECKAVGSRVKTDSAKECQLFCKNLENLRILGIKPGSVSESIKHFTWRGPHVRIQFQTGVVQLLWSPLCFQQVKIFLLRLVQTDIKLFPLLKVTRRQQKCVLVQDNHGEQHSEEEMDCPRIRKCQLHIKWNM